MKIPMKPIPDKSLRANLEAIASYCEAQAEGDTVHPRKYALEQIAAQCRKLALGRYATRLLHYME